MKELTHKQAVVYFIFMTAYVLVLSIIASGMLFMKMSDFSDVSGRYSPIHRAIMIDANREFESQIIKTAYHEIGHDVWYHRIHKAEKKKFINISNDENCFVGYTNKTTEDFADSYAYWKLNKTLCQQKKDYFSKLVIE